MVGQTLLHYRIIRQLGKGGMGEVYLAEDARLDRQVAVKVLPERLRQNTERLARFRREAKAAASLKHPNIATIYALEEEDSVLFITMEYVEGKALSAHIPNDGMDLDTFFATFIPLADALAHAHGHGRIHRDLKPGNIMITEDGTPKILDFGLARIIDPDPVQAAYEESQTPPEIGDEDSTVTMKPEDQAAALKGVPSLTRGGQLMGTPQYMSPEQAEREETDHRTDIFSFGVVMYETLTGQKPFEGKTLESIIGRILAEEPRSISELKPITPHTLWWTVRKCLEKNRTKRTQTAEEMHRDLLAVQQELQAGTVLVDASTIPPPPEPEPVIPVPFWRQPIGIVGMILTLAIGLIAAWLLKPSTEPPLRKFELALEPFESPSFNGPVISPDGTMVAYPQGSPSTLWIRDLDAVTPRELPNTEGAQRPFWSPNSDFVAYFTADNPMTLRKVSAAGGPSIPLCETGGYPRGGAWRPDGTIVFGVIDNTDFERSGVLYVVSSQGGEPIVFALADSSQNERGLIYPTFLPDGSVLYAVTVGKESGVLVAQKGQDRRMVLHNQNGRMAFPVYSSTGHIVYQRGFPNSEGIWAVPFDAGSLKATGDSFPVDVEGRFPTVSSDGTLVYHHTMQESGRQQLVWVDRNGRITGAIAQPEEEMGGPMLSPDGRWIVVTATVGGNTDIWKYDVERGTSLRLTKDPAIDSHPAWLGQERIAFSSNRRGAFDIYVTAAHDQGEPQLLVAGPVWDWMQSSYQHERYLVYGVQDLSGDRGDIWIRPWEDEGAGEPFIQEPFDEKYPMLSPDGRYLAYVSNETGRREVYVTRFPSHQGKVPVTVHGGDRHRWNSRGDELFYITEDTLMMVPIETEESFRVAGRPEPLFTGASIQATFPQIVVGTISSSAYDVSSDGQRFVVVQNVGEGTQQITMTIVQNWTREFEGRE